MPFNFLYINTKTSKEKIKEVGTPLEVQKVNPKRTKRHRNFFSLQSVNTEDGDLRRIEAD